VKLSSVIRWIALLLALVPALVGSGAAEPPRTPRVATLSSVGISSAATTNDASTLASYDPIAKIVTRQQTGPPPPWRRVSATPIYEPFRQEPTDSAGATAAEEGAAATADVAKFSNYAFVTDKAPVFESYGYTAEDSQQLADLYEQQAAEKYASGDFTEGKLDQYGQRITIQIDLPGQGAAAGRSTILNTGWMIEPGGSIRLITPFAGFGQ
jgi:hypothetical protein